MNYELRITNCLLAVDPGRDKCGVCVVDGNGEIKYQRVIETARLEEVVSELGSRFELQTIVLGNGTTSAEAARRISAIAKDIQIEVVDEKHTTEQARVEYWKKKPPRGWRRLLPTSMQVPPEPVDDIVAEILARRFIKKIREVKK